MEMRAGFHKRLREIQDEVLEMGNMVRKAVLLSIDALKDKDMVELKRSINKLKKTCDAIEGEIAGFGEDWIVVTPAFATIYRTKQTSEVVEE